MMYRRLIFIWLLLAGPCWAGPSGEPCDPNPDSIYWEDFRATHTPNFTQDPDTLGVVLIVPSVWTGYTWPYVDSTLEAAVDSLNDTYGQCVNIVFQETIIHGMEPDWVNLYVGKAAFDDAIAYLDAVDPDSQIQFLLPYGVLGGSGVAGTIRTNYATAYGMVTASPTTNLWSYLVHEMGHVFGLQHSFLTLTSLCNDPCRDWPETYDTVSDSVRYLWGDYCPDVPPDPHLTTDGYPDVTYDTLCDDSAWDAGGGSFPSRGIMSYGNDAIRDTITPDQATIMRSALAVYLQRFVRVD